MTVDHGDNAFAILGRFLPANDHDVAIINVVVDHRLTLDAEGEMVLPRQQFTEINLFVLGNGFEGGTGGDQTEHRENRRRASHAGNGDRPGGRLLVQHAFVSLDEALLFQGFQMAHHTVGRHNREGLANLADRRRVATLHDFVADEEQNFILAGSDGTRVGHG